MTEPDTLLNEVTLSPKNLWRALLIVIGVAIFPLIMLYVFGYSAKTTPEYACAMQQVEKNHQVTALTGTPVKPGLFAWTQYFESDPISRQGVFSTSIRGPRGSGRVQVQFYRSPVGESMTIWFTSKGDDVQVYDGQYPCRE